MDFNRTKEAWNRILNKKQNIELYKIDFLSILFKENINLIKGRIELPLVIKENEEYKFLGSIYIKGYRIIPNFFKELEKKCESNNLEYQKKFLKNFLKKEEKENIKWIIQNLDLISEFFEKEEEIIIVEIEKGEKYNG